MPQKPKSPPKKKKKKTDLPDDDLALWQKVAETVEPLGPVDILPDIMDEPFRPATPDAPAAPVHLYPKPSVPTLGYRRSNARPHPRPRSIRFPICITVRNPVWTKPRRDG